MSLTGCRSVKVIRSDEVIVYLPANKSFRPAVPGVFMSEALYRRYRRAVADRILEEEKK